MHSTKQENEDSRDAAAQLLASAVARQKVIDDGTKVPLSWAFKAFCMVLGIAPIVWWAATLTTDMSYVKIEVASIDQKLEILTAAKQTALNR